MIRIKSVLRETFVRTLYHIGYKKAFTLNNIKQAFTEENVSSVAPIMQGIQSDFVIIHNLPLFFFFFAHFILLLGQVIPIQISSFLTLLGNLFSKLIFGCCFFFIFTKVTWKIFYNYIITHFQST